MNNQLEAVNIFVTPIVDFYMKHYIGHKHQEIYIKDLRIRFSDEHMRFLDNFDLYKTPTDNDVEIVKQIQKFVSNKMADLILEKATLISKLGLDDEPTSLQQCY